MKILKKDLLFSLICGEIVSLLLIFLIKNPKIEEFHGLSAEAGNFIWFLILVLPLIFFLGIFFANFFKKFQIFYQLIKFLEVGVLNTFLDLGILSILMLISGISAGWFYSLFKAISFIGATSNSYFWNKLWTFQKREFSQAKKEFTQFLVVSGFGFAINVATASLIVNLIGPRFGFGHHFWGIFAAIIAGLVGMSWNFLGYKFFVFKK